MNSLCAHDKFKFVVHFPGSQRRHRMRLHLSQL
jgi:hypothetical protein